MLEKTSNTSDIRAVLFDLDGTLVDSVGLIRASMRHATLTVLGIEIPDDVLMAQVGLPLAEQMSSFSEDRSDELMSVYREHNWRVHDDMIAEYPGTRDVLDGLQSRHTQMGVVTSKSRSVALRGIEGFGLEGYFDVVICSDDVDRHKPDPHPIEKAAEILGVPPEHTAYVGDSPFDVEAANAAGATSIAVTWGVFDGEALLQSRPDYMLDTPLELGRLLEGEGDPYACDYTGSPEAVPSPG